MKNAIIIVLIFSLLLVIVGGATEREVIELPPRLLSPVELQEYLIEKGYDLGPSGVDGIIGPRTITCWTHCAEREYIARSAAVVMKGWNQ